MKRFLTILGWVVPVLFALVLLLGVLMTTTPVGMAMLDRFGRPVIEDVVSAQLGSDVSYGELAGSFPNKLVLRDLELSQDGEVWARARVFTLDWNPLDLLSGEVHVEEVVLADGALYRVPDIPEKPQPEEDRGGAPSLPDIRADEVVINDFVLGAPVLGERYTFSVQARGRYAGETVRASLRAVTEEGTDELVVEARLDGEEIRLDASLFSAENGIISKLAGTRGPTELRTRAEGPLEDLEARLIASAGQYGELRGSLRGSIDEANRLRADLRYNPGGIVPDDARTALGEEVTLSAEGLYADDEIELSIAELSGAFGRIGGDVRATLGDAPSGSADLAGTIEPSALEPYGAEALGGAFSLDASASQEDEAYAFSGTLEAGDVRLRVTDGSSSEDVPFAGRVALNARGVTLGDERIDPILAEGLSARAELRYGADGTLAARGLRAQAGTTVGRRVIVTGQGRYGVESSEVSADLRLVAGPRTVGRFLENGSVDGTTTVDLAARGTTGNLAVDANADLPSGTLNERSFPAGRLLANVGGLPGAPAGTVRLFSGDGGYQGEAAFGLDGNQLTVSEVTFDAEGIALSGQGTFNTETNAARADLAFEARAGTQIITGQTIGGSLDLTASVGPGLGPVDLALEGRNLRFEGNEIQRLDLTAEGPREAIAFDLAARDVTAAALYLTSLSSTGTVDLGEDQGARIETLTASLPGGEEDTVSLAAPANVAWGDGFSLSETRIDYLGEGVITASADIGTDRWLAELTGRDIPIPRAGATANLSLSLDTAQAKPATFDLRAEGAPGEESYAVAAEGRWTGDAVLADARILRDGSEVLGTVDASVPIRLTEEDGIGFEVLEEGLDVRIAYDDRIAPLYAFVPVDGEPLRGTLQAEVTVSGKTASPTTDGRITLSDGRFEERQIGLALTNLNGDIVFNVAENATRAVVDITGSGASGRDNSVELAGEVSLGGETSRIDLNLDLDRAQLARSAELELQATADLSLQGDLDEMTLSGPIRLDELDFAIPTEGGGEEVPTYAPVNVVRVDGQPIDAVEEVDAERETPVTVNLDLSVKANNALFVRGRGLQSEWSADLQIGGTVEDPVIGGEVNLVQGELNLAGRSFEVTEGVVGFQRSEELNPIIDLRAETEAGDGADSVTAFIDVEGPADDPTISFSSNPVLPEEDVLALILFGRPATELGATEALQLAQAAATLTGTGPFGGGAGIGASLRSGLGLDRLSFDPGENALSAGKYISDDIYVSARQSIGEVGTVISVVYEISRFFNVETTYEPDGEQTLGANYKRDY